MAPAPTIAIRMFFSFCCEDAYKYAIFGWILNTDFRDYVKGVLIYNPDRCV